MQLRDLAAPLNDTGAPKTDSEGKGVGAIDTWDICCIHRADRENGGVDASTLEPKAQGLEVGPRGPHSKNSDRRCAGRRMPEAIDRGGPLTVDVSVSTAQGAPWSSALTGEDRRDAGGMVGVPAGEGRPSLTTHGRLQANCAIRAVGTSTA